MIKGIVCNRSLYLSTFKITVLINVLFDLSEAGWIKNGLWGIMMQVQN
jgi:hypothetical protein